MDLSTLRTNFKRAIIRTDVTDAQANTYLSLAQSRAERSLRIPSNEKTVTYTIASPYAHPTIPNDFLRARALYYKNKPLKKMALKDIIRMAADDGSTESGTPLYYAREGNQFRLYPTPAVGDTNLTLIYWGEFEEMTADGDENTLAAIAPDLLIYGALVFAASDYADERVAVYEQFYQTFLAEIVQMAEDEEMGDGPLQIEPASELEY